jgi:tetratricopeptide (TPR) repeat protein
MDLRGLAALFGKINALLGENSRGIGDIDSLDLFGLSRFLSRRGESDRAHSACAQAIDLGLPMELHANAQRDLARMAKRCGDHERAAALWQEIIGDPQEGILACEQLAIYYERRRKDTVRAAEFAKLALAKLHLKRANARDPFAAARFARLEQKFLHRLARLQHLIKSAKARPNCFAPLAPREMMK